MALQYSVNVRNAQLDALETTVGTAPLLRIYSGSAPANCAAAASGTLLAELTLPADWMAAASSGSKMLSGTWQDTSANATGTAGHWRLYDSGGSSCHAQGSITATGDGGDLTFDNTSITVAGQITITNFVINAGNA
jgi:hypothetical protein